MKKVIIGIIVILLIGSGIGVYFLFNNDKGSMDNDNSAKKTLENSSSTDETTSTLKTLVVYFSKTGENYSVGNVEVGNTALMASYIVNYLGADSFEIVPVRQYSENYETSTEEAKKEQKENARPKIKNKLENLEDYDTVFIGYPIWWGDLPMIVYTFLESYDFRGKTVIPFNTHEGSGSAGTYDIIKNKLDGASVNTNGLAVQGKVARTNSGKDKTIAWLKELGY